MIIINDKPHDYNDDFKMVMTSMLPNPSFSPELFAKCCIIDFTVTMAGLEQQVALCSLFFGHSAGLRRAQQCVAGPPSHPHSATSPDGAVVVQGCP